MSALRGRRQRGGRGSWVLHYPVSLVELGEVVAVRRVAGYVAGKEDPGLHGVCLEMVEQPQPVVALDREGHVKGVLPVAAGQLYLRHVLQPVHVLRKERQPVVLEPAKLVELGVAKRRVDLAAFEIVPERAVQKLVVERDAINTVCKPVGLQRGGDRS